MYHHTDEADPRTLPDLEVWANEIVEVDCPSCGLFDVPQHAARECREIVLDDNGTIYDVERPDTLQGQFYGNACYCPSCDKQDAVIVNEYTGRLGHWYAFGLPGCLHDSDTHGPFESEALALADARETAGV